MVYNLLGCFSTKLEKLDSSVMVEGEWNKVEIGIGRQREKFQIGFNLVYISGAIICTNVKINVKSYRNSIQWWCCDRQHSFWRLPTACKTSGSFSMACFLFMSGGMRRNRVPLCGKPGLCAAGGSM